MASMLCLKTEQFLSMHAFGVAYQAFSSGDSSFVNLTCADFHIFNSSLTSIAFIHSLNWVLIPSYAPTYPRFLKTSPCPKPVIPAFSKKELPSY